jgi:hypothetical protein
VSARLIYEHNEMTRLAWHVAAFQKMSRLPRLQDVLHTGPKKKSPPEALSSMLRSASKGLQTMTMADYRAKIAASR